MGEDGLDLNDSTEEQMRSKKYVEEFIESLEKCEDITILGKLISDLRADIQKGKINPLLLKTSPLFDKLVELMNDSQYVSLTESISGVFTILGIKIEEVKQFILQIEAKEAITRFLNQYLNHPRQDLVYTRYITDFWTYPIHFPGISYEKLDEIFEKLISKKKSSRKELVVPEEVSAKNVDELPVFGEKIMEDKAMEFFESVKHKFPITVDQLIQESSVTNISAEYALNIYEHKQNLLFHPKSGSDTKDTNGNVGENPALDGLPEGETEEIPLLGIECFSFILLLIQQGKIKIDSQTNKLYI
jgi:hypothetical protein